MRLNDLTLQETLTWARLGRAGAFCIAYIALDWMSFIDALHRLNITPWSPAPALGILFLLRGGPARAAYLLAVLVTSDLIVRNPSSPLAITVALNGLLAACYLGMAQLLKRFAAEEGMFSDRVGLAKWSSIIVLGSLANSVLFVSGLVFAGLLPSPGWPAAVMRFWVGDAVGILVTLPLLWWLQDARRRLIFRTTVLRWETLGYVSLVLLLLWLTFAPGAEINFRYFYVLFLPLVWAASRQGLAGAIFCASCLQLGMLGAGWIWEAEGVSIFELQMRALMLAIVGFLIGVAVDEQRRAASELRQSLRLAAAGEMAAALAHELNQPLTALAAYGSAGKQLLRGGSGEQLGSVIQSMLRESERAAEIVRRLRDFFRTGATNLERFALADLIEAALDPFRGKAAAAGIALSAGAVPDIHLHADRLQLEVVLRNLLANAFEAVAANPEDRRKVRVTTELLEADQLCIRIEDSGAGLAASISDQAFEPFVSTKSSGLGLGLAISRSIAEAHGGSLVAELGNHGCFKLILPVDTSKEPGHG